MLNSLSTNKFTNYSSYVDNNFPNTLDYFSSQLRQTGNMGFFSPILIANINSQITCIPQSHTYMCTHTQDRVEEAHTEFKSFKDAEAETGCR